MTGLGPNAALIGQPGSRQALDTPALLLDLDALERNIAAMAASARATGVGLRPHAKTHKSARIAGLQIAAGALGICCATLGEARGDGGRRASRPAHHLAAGDAAQDRAADGAQRCGRGA